MMSKKENPIGQEGLLIPNAGLVLLNAYFIMLFDRLGIVKEKQFITEEAQLDALIYLQFLATGETTAEEHHLLLNKVLCGISLETPVKEGLNISIEQKELMEGLLKSAIGHWSAIGRCSIDGFRGNWLVREGILREEEDRWVLNVERRAYDILILKSPFSFSIIKMPWMKKPLHVVWPY